MNERVYRISEWVVKELAGSISEEEARQLAAWRRQSASHEALYRQLQDEGYLSEGVSALGGVDTAKPLAAMQWRIALFRRRQWLGRLRWAGGVAALAVVAIGAFWLLREEPMMVPVVAEAPIPAGSPRALLRLGNGEVVDLDTLQRTITQGAVSVSKSEDRKLSYVGGAGSGTVSGKTVYNEVEVPKGGEYDLVLADGTAVWLNAESRLRFPVEFRGKERKVVLEGEAYFEVKRDAERPFRVEVRGSVVEVLGTEFNVSGYGDDEQVYTTLVAGKVKVEAQGGDLVLSPGEQCVLTLASGAMSKQRVDVEKFIAWKKGWFILEEQTLEQIMQKLARWYDMAVFYRNPGVKGTVFKGSVPRYTDLRRVLEVLEKTEEVHFSVQGNTVVVHE